MTEKPARSLIEMLLLFAAFFLPGYAAQGFLSGSAPPMDQLMVQSIIAGIPQFLLMAYVAVAAGQTAPGRWGFVRFEPRDVLRTIGLLFACFAVVTPFLVLVISIPSDLSGFLTHGYRWGLQGASQIPLALLFGITAGYREEFFFRSYMLGRLDELGMPLPAAVAVSTALFSMGHLYEGLLAILITACLGVLLSVSWLRRRSLHVVAIAHGLYNTVILCLGLLLPHTLPQAAVVDILHLQ